MKRSHNLADMKKWLIVVLSVLGFALGCNSPETKCAADYLPGTWIDGNSLIWQFSEEGVAYRMDTVKPYGDYFSYNPVASKFEYAGCDTVLILIDTDDASEATKLIVESLSRNQFTATVLQANKQPLSTVFYRVKPLPLHQPNGKVQWYTNYDSVPKIKRIE